MKVNIVEFFVLATFTYTKMIRYHDGTIFIIFGDNKIEFWAEKTWKRGDYFLKLHLRPTWNLWFQKGIFGAIFLTEWIIFQIGVSYELLTPERMEEVLKEINDEI